MTEWRLTPEGEAVLAEWKKTATPDQQHLLAEILETIPDDSWQGRWHNAPHPSNPNLVEIRTRELIVIVHGMIDETQPVMWIDLLGITANNQQAADQFDA